MIMGIVYFLAGLNHFIMPDFYLKIMPPYLPFHLALVYLSGIAEMICGVLLTFVTTRRIGAWLTIALLIFVFPANIQMSLDLSHKGGLLFYASILRLPFQFLFIYWAYLFTKEFAKT